LKLETCKGPSWLAGVALEQAAAARLSQSPPGALGAGSQLLLSSRSKRMRTSFKHNQLRTMKAYFALNHNPDAKDLKQLAQKTGLTKRVLQVGPAQPGFLYAYTLLIQVWFQNARAKYRRAMQGKQDGGVEEPTRPDFGLSRSLNCGVST